MLTRKEANWELLNMLSVYLMANPEIRFGQALTNLRIVEGKDSFDWKNHFYEEPADMLARVKMLKEVK